MYKKGRLIIYSGPSGVGKGTILAPLLADESYSIVLSVSATTRKPRVGERDGVHYHFITTVQFAELVAEDKLLEHATYNGDHYGTPREAVEQMLMEGKDVVLEIEVQGAMKVKERYPQALMVFIMPPSFDALYVRLKGRGTETKEQLENRLKIAMTEIRHANEYDFIIINSDADYAREQLLAVVTHSQTIARFHHKHILSVLADAKDFWI